MTQCKKVTNKTPFFQKIIIGFDWKSPQEVTENYGFAFYVLIATLQVPNDLTNRKELLIYLNRRNQIGKFQKY